MSDVFYNEIDPFCADWLRELMARDLIPVGDIDERSIEDIRPDELMGYRQCHFFAGIGGWALALRTAGWPDDRPVWTGSCPCQPFSAAGKGAGFADERHLWPSFYHLIAQCAPGVVFGEQVASNDGLAWLDLVCADLEAAGYAVWAVDTCAAGFGAPHIRQRLYWVAHTEHSGYDADGGGGAEAHRISGVDREEVRGGQPGRAGGDANGTMAVATSERRNQRPQLESNRQKGYAEQNGLGCVIAGPMGDSERGRLDERKTRDRSEQTSARGASRVTPAGSGGTHPLDNTLIPRLERHTGHGGNRHEPGRGDLADAARPASEAGDTGVVADPAEGGLGEHGRAQGQPGYNALVQPTNGFWRDAEWLPCIDGKARPVEPSTSPLAHGVPNRVGRLRGYGNAIVIPQAAEFIKAYKEEVGL